MNNNVALFDMDGTLSDPNWRRPLLDSGNWREFFDRCGEDPPRQHIVDMFISSSLSGYATYVVSARPEWTRMRTLIWLRSNVDAAFDSSQLFMRTDQDMRPDQVVKREFLMNFDFPIASIGLVVDDRPKVLRMWREELPHAEIIDVGSGLEF